MENYQGDLTDIVRASGGAALSQSDIDAPMSSWEFPNSYPININNTNNLSIPAADDNRDSFFGDPFCNMRDPLLHVLNVTGSGYFSGSTSSTDMLSTTTSTTLEDTSSFCAAAGANSSNILGGHDTSSTTTCNIFSRIQISPTNNPNKLPVDNSPIMAAASSPRGFKPSAMVSTDMINANCSKNCLIDNTGPVQISSPRNLGIKRRKSQAKKVVCIPAPAATNSRPSGEVVPSDLWAWRKYGQKPIKGSPYPRGYYRCSSSKGCSARKQVERSRTDPNMLVITYTSEHNHPWPTQRNALAGSTRSQPPKNNNAASTSKTSSPAQKTNNNAKEEQKESSSNDTLSPTTNIVSPSSNNTIAASGTGALVKEEFEGIEKQMEMEMEMEDTDQPSEGGMPQSYRPAMPADQTSDDFFADLGEIEPDPDLDLLFSQGFMGGDDDHGQDTNTKGSNIKAATLDPFGIFDWCTGDNSTSSTTSFGDAAAKRG